MFMKLTSRIIRCYYRTYYDVKRIKRHYDEKTLGDDLYQRLVNDHLSVVTQQRVSRSAQGKPLAQRYNVLDLVVEDIVVVELKNVLSLSTAHYDQLETYLLDSHKPVGLLLNFGFKDKPQPREIFNREIIPNWSKLLAYYKMQR